MLFSLSTGRCNLLNQYPLMANINIFNSLFLKDFLNLRHVVWTYYLLSILKV
jgi:hypothetical protein